MELSQYFDRLYNDYDKYLYIPLGLFVLSTIVIGANFALTGEVVRKGIDFTGGTEITYKVQNGSFQVSDVEDIFADKGVTGVKALKQTKNGETFLLVQVPPPTISQDKAEQVLESEGFSVEVKGFRNINSAVSQQFFQTAVMAFFIAFSVMSFVIFMAFKDIIPATAVIFAAMGDILFSLAAMTILGIPLTLGSLAALLMLIGYSVDTDIVLSTRVLKKDRGSLKERVWSSMKTGVTMSSGGIAGFTLLFIVSVFFVGESTLSTIASVMVIGLIADMPFTWLGNAIILKKYEEDQLKTIKIVEEKVEGVNPWS